MDDVEDSSPLKSHSVKMSMRRRDQQSTIGRDSNAEVKNMLEMLNTWKDESQMQFSKIVDSFNTKITEGINDLTNEVCDLQAQLSHTTQERNNLKETINDLNDEIRELNGKLISVQYYPGDEENYNQDKLIVGNTEIGSLNTVKSAPDSPITLSDGDDESIDSGKILGHIPAETVEQHKSYQTNNRSLNDQTPYEMADMDVIDIEHEAKEEDKVDGSVFTIPKNVLSEDVNCPECSFTFSTREHLIVHSLNIHSQLPPREVNLDEKEVSISQSKCLPLKEDKITKLQSESNTGEGYEDLKSKSMTWKKSGTGNLGDHEKYVIRYGDKRFTCEHCPYSASKKCVIKSHIKEVHDKTKDHACEECEYVTSRKRSLMRHLDAVHKLGDKRYKCEKCPYSSAEKARLKYHNSSVHSIGEKIKCDKCPFSSARKDEIKRHIELVHERIKKHVCGECGYATTRNSLLEHHIKYVHKNLRLRMRLQVE